MGHAQFKDVPARMHGVRLRTSADAPQPHLIAMKRLTLLELLLAAFVAADLFAVLWLISVL
jgi:hypothetical protein